MELLKSGRRSAVVIDVTVITVIAVIVFFVASAYEVFESFHEWLQTHDGWQVDELLIVGIYLVLAFGVFSARRWREGSNLLAEREQTLKNLQAAKEGAEAANRAKGEFLANMSHEIRTPMNGVLGMTELALGTNLDTQQREFLNTVQRSARSLLQVLNDVLDFSKIEAGKLELEPAPFSFRDSFRDVMTLLEIQAAEKQLELTYRVAPDVPDHLMGDSLRLRQVLVNLAGNAVKFTDRGEVAINAELMSLEGKQATIQVSVRDTGIGISPKVQSRIFEAFTQADGSTTRQYGGTGLGLTISLRIVGLMGGRLWVDSLPGCGSTFHFTVLLEVSGEPSPAPRASAPGLRGRRVLVVDDNPTSRRILEELLTNWGMRSTCVGNGPRAIAAARDAVSRNDPYTIVLLDCMMPDMDGFTAASELKSLPQSADLVMIMLTSSGRGNEVARCREAGILKCVSKPVASSDLLNMLLATFGEEPRPAPPPQVETQTQVALPIHSILIAEDNLVNQRVAAGLLEKRGYSVVAVSNGKQALQALQCQRFDVVLMDVQMPEMDGVEATIAWRKLEAATGEHVPIVALTAHALKGDRERFLAAGMDDYLPKPVDGKDLAAAIERQLGCSAALPPSTPRNKADEQRSTASEHDASVVPANTDVAVECLDLRALRARVEDDLDLMGELISLFMESSPMLLAEIDEAVTARDCRTVERAAHSLKGALWNLCAAKAGEKAHEVEQLGHMGDMRTIDQTLLELKEEMITLQRVLYDVSPGASA